MKVAVVGGGITGLTAAYLLSKKGHRVTIFEKEKSLGGLASSFKDSRWSWPLERYFHHFFASDREVVSLAKALGLKEKLFFRKPKTSVLVDSQIFQFDSPKSILLFPKLGFIDKIKTGIISVALKLNPFWQPLEKITAVDFINKTMGKKTFKLIWEPLFQSKFGSLSGEVPASWFWTRIKKRSFSLGYFEGGTASLVEALRREIEKAGSQVLTKHEVSRIQKTAGSFAVTVKEKNLLFDRVIVTVPPTTLLKIFPHLSQNEKKQIKTLKSLGSLCLILSLKEKFLADGTYWLNINDGRFPFVAVVEHTNFIDSENYGGDNLLYLGGYYPTNHPFFGLEKEAILKEFLPFLQKINSAYDFCQGIKNSWLFKDTYSQPIISLNYSQRRPRIKTSVPGFFWASLHHVYPEDRGVNYAISLGKETAHEVENF